jgi:pimeloyl-ACP methyl ester carboxylesterase
LQRFHISLGSGLPVIQFAVPKRLDGLLTASYSFRLLQNFGPPRDYIGALARTQVPVTVLIGQRDEIMYPDRFADALKTVKDHVTVTVLPGVSHMSIVIDPRAIESVVQSSLMGSTPEGPQLSSSTT